MEITKAQAKLIDNLRKEERWWPKLRWAFLTVAFASMGLACAWGYLFHSVFSDMTTSQNISMDSVFVFAFFWTKCCVWICFGILFFCKAAIHWRGNVTRILLLKLLDEQQKSKAAE
jgi:hypothetical protein